MNTQKQQGRAPIYDAAFKIAVAREYLTSHLGYLALAKKYNITAGTVRHFVRWYNKNYNEKNLSLPEKGDDNQQSIRINEQPGTDVLAQLKDANLKIELLETLIEIAGKELGVDILKKLGAKQLRK